MTELKPLLVHWPLVYTPFPMLHVQLQREPSVCILIGSVTFFCLLIFFPVIPPAKAEEMYAPDIFGRSATEKVIIE
jgi:hypothetical protein